MRIFTKSNNRAQQTDALVRLLKANKKVLKPAINDQNGRSNGYGWVSLDKIVPFLLQSEEVFFIQPMYIFRVKHSTGNL